jgi:hypothetical protein
MIEKRNKPDDGPLEVNIIFPERIIGVDEKGLRLVCGNDCQTSRS